MSPNPENNDTHEGSEPCKLRYKGIENFLRRVAFNLGNSPSQTEVKIISCIPIDVTDLQAKIISLEKQLQEAKNSKGSTKNIPVHTALINSNVPKANCECCEIKPLVLQNDNGIISQCCDGSSKARKSEISFQLPSWSETGFSENKSLPASENEATKEATETNNKRHHKNFFRRGGKRKKAEVKKHPKTQMVYYAHTENTPFKTFGKVSTYNICKNHSKTNVENELRKAYLTNVVQRHFDPELVEEFSDTSHFTSPVCRDFSSGRCPYESDVCSCCHGQFQNIDNYITRYQNFITEPLKTPRFNKSIYYDTNHYDMIPVREKTFKVLKEEKLPKKERHVLTQCWLEDERSKPCYHRTVCNQKNKLKNHKRPINHLQENEINIRIKSPEKDKKDKGIGVITTSKSCWVGCSEVYTKPIFTAKNNRKVDSTPPKLRQNAECLTIDVGTNKLAITKSIQIDINSAENKTEETLNQIKSILQSVLAEVRTNPRVNNMQTEKPKNDAIIQNGPSQSNIQTCSSFLHSFTYNNSYDTNPHIPSCSRQIPPNSCYSNFPYQRIRCPQNFPVIIHPPGDRICGCLNKSSGHTDKPHQRQAATTATNTETGNQEDKAKETDKLIKEIYKSLALTMDKPKNSSNSEYDEVKFTTTEPVHTNNLNKIRSTIVAMSSIQKRDIQIEAAMTPLCTTTLQNKCNCTILTRNNAEETEVDHYTPYESETIAIDEIPVEKLLNRPKIHVATTISEHDSEDLSTKNEGGEIIEENQNIKVKTGKKGLLRRILESVQFLSKRNKNKAKTKHVVKQVIDDEQSESDSDDYRTTFSEKSNKKSNHIKRQLNKPGIYQDYRPLQQGVRVQIRSPYMEQEYRKQWEENLIFQENRNRRYSSERPFSVQRTSPISSRRQNCQAKSVLVDNLPYCRKAYYGSVRNTDHKIEKRTSANNFPDKAENVKSKISWLKRHKLGVCDG